MKLQEFVHYVHEQRTDLPQEPRDLAPQHRGHWPGDRAQDMGGERLPVPDWITEAMPLDEGQPPERPDRCPRGDGSDFPDASLVPEMLAYYLPYHFYGRWAWGIYVLESGIVRLAQKVSGGGEMDEPLEVALEALLAHERFHCLVETGATRLETVLSHPVYEPLFWSGQVHLQEEAMANAEAARTIRSDYARFSPPLEAFMARCPPGYRDFAQYLAPAADQGGRQALANTMRPMTGLPSTPAPLRFLLADLKTTDESYLPLTLVLDGHRRGLALPGPFIRRELKRARLMRLR